MADAKPAAGPEPASTQSDEAAYAAGGLRTTARWIAGAFAGIPSLAIVGALITGPGDKGYDHLYLGLGVGLAAAGAAVGILLFARVLTPVALADKAICPSVMDRLPEASFASYGQLRTALEQARNEVGNDQMVANDRAGRAGKAEEKAKAAEAAAKLANDLLGDETPPDADKVEDAKTTRRAALEARTASAVAIGKSKIAAQDLEASKKVFEALESLRRGAYGLQAGDSVKKRYRTAYWGSLVAVGLVAAGVAFLAIAPKPKGDDKAAAAPELVTLHSFTPAGTTALGCTAATADAIKVGGDETAPTVIVLPRNGCPARMIKFTTKKDALGKVTKAKVVE